MNQQIPPESPASVALTATPTLYQTYGYGTASSEPATPTSLIQNTWGAGFYPDINMLWSPAWSFAAATDVLHQDPSSSASCSTDAAAVYLNCLNNNPLTNRLTPLTPSGPPNPYATAPHHQFSMPGQSVASAQMPYTVTRNGYNSGAGTPRPGSGAGKRTGGRRPKEEEYEHPLNEEDRDKRDKRRQRNKEAAARCRQRRLDLMSTLQNEVDNLKQRNNAHEALIDQLKNEKDVLIRALTSHGCKIPNQVSSNLASLIPTTTVPSYITASVPSSQSSVTQPLGLKRPHPDGNIYTVPLTSIKTELDNDYIPSSISSNGVSTAGSMLPPPLKKIQNQNQPPHSRHNTSQEPTLTQVNAPAGNEMERPSTLPIPGATSGVDGGYDESKSGLWSGMPSITTPSGIMNDGTYPFLYTDTGLTPVSAQPALPVCTLGTPTPLGDNELRPL
ncbi:hypothetical protein L596_021774 [Steinernema carpocapsae]|uniref:BZIP domain-containing protein n=1 Tax=Steinernema carpocapsae TaxID=34508 RepID=A0A4U5MJQ4_STECR|nr:hypothetical protein L596_021774 [Steinernema carpocapsae]